MLAIPATRKVSTEYDRRVQPHHLDPWLLPPMLGDGKRRNTISTTTRPDIHVHSLEDFRFGIT
jgi:hypothetical protein